MSFVARLGPGIGLLLYTHILEFFGWGWDGERLRSLSLLSLLKRPPGVWEEQLDCVSVGYENQIQDMNIHEQLTSWPLKSGLLDYPACY